MPLVLDEKIGRLGDVALLTAATSNSDERRRELAGVCEHRNLVTARRASSPKEILEPIVRLELVTVTAIRPYAFSSGGERVVACHSRDPQTPDCRLSTANLL